jgi:hypothetical protein
LDEFSKKKKNVNKNVIKPKIRGTPLAIFPENLDPPKGFLEKLQLPLPGFSTRVFLYFFSTLFVQCTATAVVRYVNAKPILSFYFIIVLQFAFYMDAIVNRTIITICIQK